MADPDTVPVTLALLVTDPVVDKLSLALSEGDADNVALIVSDLLALMLEDKVSDGLSDGLIDIDGDTLSLDVQDGVTVPDKLSVGLMVADEDIVIELDCSGQGTGNGVCRRNNNTKATKTKQTIRK